MIDKIPGAMRALLPPAKDADPTSWRVTVFVSIVVLGFMVVTHQLASYGYLESIGISRVANASELNQVDERTKAILRAIYSPQVRGKVRERCDTNDPREREKINKELDRILNEYKDGSGEDFRPIPKCGEV